MLSLPACSPPPFPQVRSQGYGVVPPPKAERPPPKESEPLWTPTLSVAKPELSEVPRSKLNDKVCVCKCVCVCV